MIYRVYLIQDIIRYIKQIYPFLSFSLPSPLSPFGVNTFKDALLGSSISALNDSLSDLSKKLE